MDIETVREKTYETIENACSSNYPVLLESPSGSGKSTAIYQLAVDSDTPPIKTPVMQRDEIGATSR